MRRCRQWTSCGLLGALLLGLVAAGCGGGGSTTKVTVTVSPSSVTVIVNGTRQFVATVSNASDTSVKWFVNDKEGGDINTVGSISTAGLYTAPAAVPSPNTVTVKAVSNADSTASGTVTVTLDSGVRVSIAQATATVGTNETFDFSATVTNDSTDPTKQGVTWMVQGTNTGAITSTGTYTATYTAPGLVPTPATVTIQATAKVDPSRTATATVTIVQAKAPTLTAVSPTSVAQGSLVQNFYLTGTNLLSTTTVFFDNTPLQSGVKLISGTLMRVRIPAALLTTANTSPGVPVTIAAQNQPALPPQFFVKIKPVRPALVEVTPDSATQTPVSGVTFQINGGYFGTQNPSQSPPPSPVVSAQFNGIGGQTLTNVSPRQLSVSLTSGAVATAGLFSVTLTNTTASQLQAAANFAVQPCVDSAQACAPVTPPSIEGPLLPVGGQPGAVAINTATGIAVVTNRGSNNITLIDLKTSPPSLSCPGAPPCPIAVGAAPTGVAVDNVQHLALVVNSGDKSVSVVDLIGRTVTSTINLRQITTATPISVGVNPISKLAVVAYQSTNSASLINLDTSITPACLAGTSPFCVIGTVTANTGLNPQVAVEPRLNWAIVTPGSAGVLSIVDLSRQNSNPIAAAPNGAVRSASGVLTITTTTSHLLDPTNPGSVLITGATNSLNDSSFNGTFTVASVPSSTTFTIQLPCTPSCPAPATGGGGQVNYASPVATFAITPTVTGIAINSETETAVLADPSSTSVSFVSFLDQTNTATPANTIDLNAVASAFNPFTNVAVTVNPIQNQISLIDPVSLTPLPKISTGGSGSKAVAIDPGTNFAVVANETSNDVSIISLGSIKSLHISQILINDPKRQLFPNATLTSPDPLDITILGHGFSGSPTVRLDGTAISTTSVTVVSDRQINATVLAAMLTAPRRYAVDVINGSLQSNVTDLTVVQSVILDVTNTGCTKPMPGAVAIYNAAAPNPDLAVVTNNGCKNISLIDLTNGTVTANSPIAVGTNPQGVAVISRLGKAVVTNFGDNTASIVDVNAGSVCSTCTINVGTGPLGVAINQDTATAVVTNTGSNTISVFSADTGGTAATGAVDSHPVAVAVDPDRNVALVANAQQGTLVLMDISTPTPTFKGRILLVPLTQLPTSVVFDPVSTNFFASSSVGNSFFVVNPDTQQATQVRLGINPTSLAYNFQSSTLVTVNTASNTMSVVDTQTLRTRAVLGMTGSQQFSVDIHPRTNLAVIADENNNRVLLVPLPR